MQSRRPQIAHRRAATTAARHEPLRPSLVLLVALVSLGLLALLAIAPARAQPERPPLNDGVESPFARVARWGTPAVAAISVAGGTANPLEEMHRRFMPRDREQQERNFDMPGSGSGFVVSSDGYILTNNHVIEGAERIEVRLPGMDRLDARIVGQDPSTDLALLKVEPPRPLRALEFADSDGVGVGDYAIAIGNPLGELAGTLTVGVISAKGRSDLNIQGAELRYQDFLQTDAAINFGNSGGPLMDIRGYVIGVNTAINAAGQNIGFAVPANLANKVYEQLRDAGRVVRGYLGVRMLELGDPRVELEDPPEGGVYVAEVLAGTPAEDAGLRVGDVLVRFNGQPLTDQRDVMFRIADAPVGEVARVEVLRDGRRVPLEVVLVEYDQETVVARADPLLNPVGDARWLGIGVASPADQDNPRVRELVDAYGIEGGEGVLVVDVERGSPADMARLRPGDVIVEVLDQAIGSVGDFEEAATRYAGREKPVALLVLRGGVTSYITVEPEGADE